MKDYSDKVVVITGGASGIGLSFAGRFGAEGAKIVLADINGEGLQEAQKSLAARGVEAAVKQCDTGDLAQVEALLEFTLAEYGRAEVILNGAGTGGVRERVIGAKRESIDRIMRTNFYGVWHGCTVFGQHFLEAGKEAAIYNIGSENSLYNFVPHLFAYQASKHGVFALTDALRREVPDFIQVALICPGWVQTGMTSAASGGMDVDEYTGIALAQLRAGAFFVVSHAHNIVHIGKRYTEIEEAYRTYAPRYEGDEAHDVPTLLARARAARNK